MNRICRRTGLALVDGPTEPVLRLATTSYGPLDPRERVANEMVESWARWDTPGRTVYAADSRRTAFVESTSWARQKHSATEPAQLAKTAAALGVSIAVLLGEIDADWGDSSSMIRGWLPAGWREARRMYQLRFTAGWWIDIAHSDTLMALSDAMQSELYDGGAQYGLTLADVTGEDRRLTATIATWLRGAAVLDDDTRPLGIRFRSKHGEQQDGEGLCWAFWMRERDAGQPTTVVAPDRGTPFRADDQDFQYALRLHHIEAR